MTDTTETMFGIDTTGAREAYRKAVEEASQQQDATINQLNKRLNDATTAIRAALGITSTSDGVVSLVCAIHSERHKDARQEARRRYAQARDEAQVKRDEALNADPFIKFVSEYIAEEYGHSYANTLHDEAPFTFDGLKELADSEGWCGDFERAMMEGREKGALPADTVTVRRSVSWGEVPASQDAKPGETWEQVFEVPAFVRVADSYDVPRPMRLLRNFIVGGITYEKVADTATGADS